MRRSPILVCALLCVAACGSVAVEFMCDTWYKLDPDFSMSGDARVITGHGVEGTVAVMAVTILENGITYAPGADFVAHVHASQCEINNGGGHWKANESVEGAVEANEVWITLPGAGSDSVVTGHNTGVVADARAKSIVVHKPDGSRLGCCNLGSPPPIHLTCNAWSAIDAALEVTGSLRLAAQYGDVDGTVFTADLNIVNSSTNEAHVAGAEFMAHVHESPCSVNNGGGHWQLAPGGAADVTNEVWLGFTDSAVPGQFSATSTNLDVSLMPSAESVVVHKVDGTRMACCDLALPPARTLTCDEWDMIDDAYTVTGDAEIKTDGGETGGTMFTAALQIAASNNPAVGYVPGNLFFAHAHNAPCSESNGGGHWQVAPGGQATPPNELWLMFDSATLSPSFSAEATRLDVTVSNGVHSVVVHHPSGGRLACCDLQDSLNSSPEATGDPAYAPPPPPANDSEAGSSGAFGNGSEGPAERAWALLCMAVALACALFAW